MDHPKDDANVSGSVRRPMAMVSRAVHVLGLILVSTLIVLSTWHFGGVTVGGQIVCGWLAILGLLAATWSAVASNRRPAGPISFMFLALAWVFYASLQYAAFGGLTNRTVLSIMPWCTAAITMLAVVLLCNDARDRRCLAMVVVANAAVLVIWGLIARSHHDLYLLPGIAAPPKGVPFATFLYKNAGAAALIPAIAIVATTLCKRLRSDRRRKNDRHDPVVLIGLTMVLGLLLTGMAATLSRGGWLLALAALGMIACFGRQRYSLRLSKTSAAIGATIAIGCVLFSLASRTTETTTQRLDTVTVERMWGNTRFEHWQTGWSAATAHLPWGSGVGTYRYVTLPHQTEPGVMWFLHAHNQFLEWFVETGFPGLFLVIAAIALMVRHCYRQTQRQHSDAVYWGIISTTVVFCGVVFSVFDFVLAVPANTILYAVVCGMAVGLPPRGQRVGQAVDDVAVDRFAMVWRPLLPAVAILPLAICLPQAHQHARVDATLEQSRVAASAEVPRAEIVEAFKIVNGASSNDQSDDRLRRRLASLHWQLARHRIIELVRSDGGQIDWQQTDLGQLFVNLASMPSVSRTNILDRLRSDREFMRHITAMDSHCVEATKLHPFAIQPLVRRGFASFFTGADRKTITSQLLSLSMRSRDNLYRTGLIAWGDQDWRMAAKAWRLSLQIEPLHLDDILLRATAMPPLVVVNELLPPNQLAHFPKINFKAREDHGVLIAAIEERPDLEPSMRYRVIARLFENAGQDQQAAGAYAEAVRHQPRNLGLRHLLAMSLMRVEEYQRALDHASLGAAMAPRDERFTRLMRQARTAIERQCPTPIRAVNLSMPTEPLTTNR